MVYITCLKINVLSFEVAEDYGGPRKEFFRQILKEIQEQFFNHGLRELLHEKYFTIGVIFGKEF